MISTAGGAAASGYYGRRTSIGSAPGRDPLTDEKLTFIEARDSFYMATITESGWPYIQHRGGHRGFLWVVNPTQLSFADYKGNRQMLSTGNVAAKDRVALFLMDQPSCALEEVIDLPAGRVLVGGAGPLLVHAGFVMGVLVSPWLGLATTSRVSSTYTWFGLGRSKALIKAPPPPIVERVFSHKPDHQHWSAHPARAGPTRPRCEANAGGGSLGAGGGVHSVVGD